MIEKISHQQITQNKPSIAEVNKLDRHPIYLLCDDVRSLHNVGALFRTCDGVLVEKIFLCGMTGFPPRKEIQKTALGACDVVPWEYHENPLEVIKELKNQNVQIVGLELTHQSVDYTTEGIYHFPTCLVLGNEIEGINDQVLKLCDLAIEIPMFGRANSLNVATACGIAIYEILRQYKVKS